MEVYLNSLDGVSDAIGTLFLSKRNLTRSMEQHIQYEVDYCTDRRGKFQEVSDEMAGWLKTLRKYGVHECTLYRFVDLSFSVYGLHRGAQDDLDSHAKRMDNRIIRASTRLADFSNGEMSDWYKGKILTTEMVLASLGVELPEEIEYDGNTYVRATNGYIIKGSENSRDVKRGLYTLSIPSDFIFRCNLTEFSHIYKLRNEKTGANPELKMAVEQMAQKLGEWSNGYFNRQLLLDIKN